MKKPKFKPGDPVLYVNIYGDVINLSAEVNFAVVNTIEYVESRDSYLYSLVFENPFQRLKPAYRILGEHLIFSIEDEKGCQEAANKFLEEMKK